MGKIILNIVQVLKNAFPVKISVRELWTITRSAVWAPPMSAPKKWKGISSSGLEMALGQLQAEAQNYRELVM